ncbi:MAG: T9SS type A sorting domain-containing protein [Bacteroidales bacterium]
MKTISIICIVVFTFPSYLYAQQYINGRQLGLIAQKEAQTPMTVCDTIFSFTSTDPAPAGLTFGGNTLFSMGQMNARIYKYNLSGQLVGSIPGPSTLGYDGSDIDFDGTDLWVVVEEEAKIYKIDTTSGAILKSFDLPFSQFGCDHFGCAWDDGYIWITEYGDETLMRIDTSSGALVDSFATHRRISALKVLHDNLYGMQHPGPSLPGYQIVKLDRMTGLAIDSIAWCIPASLGFVFADSHLWCSSYSPPFGTRRIYCFNTLLNSMTNLETYSSNVKVYPNPAHDKLNILTNNNQNKRIEILDIMGKCILQKELMNTATEIDVSMLLTGFYLLNISGHGRMVQSKFIKD